MATLDSGITFSILLYLNIFYFGLYAVVEFSLLIFKYSLVAKYNLSIFVQELFLLSILVLIESARLLLGQKHNERFRQAPFPQRLRSIFQILVLTLPSIYGVIHFTAWQSIITRLDAVLGCIMILLQISQFVAAFLHIFPTLRRSGFPASQDY